MSSQGRCAPGLAWATGLVTAPLLASCPPALRLARRGRSVPTDSALLHVLVIIERTTIISKTP